MTDIKNMKCFISHLGLYSNSKWISAQHIVYWFNCPFCRRLLHNVTSIGGPVRKKDHGFDPRELFNRYIEI